MTLLNAPLGFDPTNVMTAGMVTPRTGTIDYEHVLRSIGARPGVESVGGAARMPFDGSGHDDGVPLPDGRRLGVTHICPATSRRFGAR